MPAKPSALFLSPEAPYPLAGGGSLRSASLLEYLARRYDVDVIVFRQPGAPDPAGLIPRRLTRSVTVLDLPAHRRSFAARALRNAGRVGATGRQARVEFYPTALPATPLRAPGEEEAMVFSGNMEYHPNLTAVRFFRREIWPRLRERWPRLVWRLVGRNPAAVRRFTA